MAKKTFRFQKVDFFHGASTGPPCDFDGLGEPVADRLILAGEHTVFDYAGTTHVALMTGVRVAEYIIDGEG